MDFRGHLRLPDDAGTGIPVVLRVDDIFVNISVGDEELGAWRADDVEIERIFSNQFAVNLAGEPMVFLAQDALGFAYEGITAIEELQARLTKRGIFRRSRKKDNQADVAVAELGDAQSGETVPAEPAPASARSRRPAAELVSHLAHPEEADADAFVPDLQPVPAPASSSLWTPATAKAAPLEEADPAVHVASAPPTESRTRPGSGERPADTRVSYPGASAPPPPAEETFVPPAIPEAEPEPELEIESELAAEPEPESEPELEIEEVTAASSGMPWGDVDFEPQPELAPEIEIEDYIPATAGEVDTFLAPQSVPEQVVTEPEAAPEIADVAEGPEEVPESAAEPEPAAAIVDAGIEDHDFDNSIQSDVATAPAAPLGDEASSTNGHKAERRSFLFGRGRDKSVSSHDHTYGESKTIGGLTRRVCSECGHVTFSGQDVYQEW